MIMLIEDQSPYISFIDTQIKERSYRFNPAPSVTIPVPLNIVDDLEEGDYELDCNNIVKNDKGAIFYRLDKVIG